MRVWTLVLWFLLSACAGGSGARESPGASEQPGAATSSGEPVSQQPGDGESLTGVLAADAVEGGCAHLRTADGTRYEVLYPDGWTLQMSPLQLIGPDGAVHARSGEPVTVRGEIATDMASICQIGPIFRATEVVSP